MATTFRTDPVTGQTRISSDNIVRASGQTDAERDARRAADFSYEPPALRASAENALNEARYNDFLRNTGRSNTNPYGNDGIITRMTGVSPDKINYTNNLGARGIESVNRLAYDQFLNPTDNRGQVRGMLREGSPTQFGPVFRNPDAQQESPGGLGSLMSFLPGVGLVKALISGRSDLAVPTPGFFPDSPERYSEQEKAFLAPLTEISSPLNLQSDTPVDNTMPATALPTTSEIIDQELQGPPQLRMDEIVGPDFSTIQGVFDFPGDQLDRRFEATSAGTDRRGGNDLLQAYLERFPLYDDPRFLNPAETDPYRF